MDYSDKVIKMKSKEEYIVIEQINNKGNTYLYLVNRENDKDAMFVEIKDGKILKINPELFEKEILPLFLEKIKDN